MFFGRPIDIDKSFVLNYATIFSDLKRLEKRLVEKRSKIVRYKKGEFVYRSGDPADAFYCVVSGRVKMTRLVKDANERIEFLTSGMYFGITSLLTTKIHSQTAEIVNDSLILKIEKRDFDFILSRIPELALDLSKTLSQQVRREHIAKHRKSTILSVYSAMREIGRSMYAVNLALSLNKETRRKVIFIDVSIEIEEEGILDKLEVQSDRRPLDLKDSHITRELIESFIIKSQEVPVDILTLKSTPYTRTLEQISSLLSLLTNEYEYVIVDLPAQMDEFAFKVLTQSDDIHLVTDYNIERLESTRSLMASLFERVEFPQERIRVILNETKTSEKIDYREVINHLDHDIFAALPVCQEAGDVINKDSLKIVLTQPRIEYSRAIRRIAREIGDVLVGLALGSGAAFGFSHIGVLKVLEREGIPIDVISGSSIGALIGAFWASGKSASEIEEIMMEYNKDKMKVFRLLGDICFPITSLAAGYRVARFLKKHLGIKTFNDTRVPLKILAAKLDTREVVTLESGSLVDAVRSSIAIPGLFKPVKTRGTLFIDGGILEPVPTTTLVESGVKKIIAVNVLPSPEHLQEGYKNYKYCLEKEKADAQKGSIIAKIIYRIRILFRKIFFPNIFDIMVNSILGMEHVMAQENCRKADVVINPIIPGANWFEFFRVEELIKRGEEEAVKAIEKIREHTA
ncbi:patatin-like phospholipase family protein [Thermoproteota archaeon]